MFFVREAMWCLNLFLSSWELFILTVCGTAGMWEWESWGHKLSEIRYSQFWSTLLSSLWPGYFSMPFVLSGRAYKLCRKMADFFCKTEVGIFSHMIWCTVFMMRLVFSLFLFPVFLVAHFVFMGNLSLLCHFRECNIMTVGAGCRWTCTADKHWGFVIV